MQVVAMRVEVMEEQAFEDALDRHGGDLDRWPRGLRAAAERLLAASPEARGLKAEMDAVEACLRTPNAAAASATPFTDTPLTNMAANAMRQRQVRPAARAVRRAVWGAATAAALLLGLVIGNSQFDGHDESPDQVVARALGVPGSIDVD